GRDETEGSGMTEAVHVATLIRDGRRHIRPRAGPRLRPWVETGWRSVLRRPGIGPEDPDQLRLGVQGLERGGHVRFGRVAVEVDPEHVLPARPAPDPGARLEIGRAS